MKKHDTYRGPKYRVISQIAKEQFPQSKRPIKKLAQHIRDKFFVEGMTQAEIARQLRTDRRTVSAFLMRLCGNTPMRKFLCQRTITELKKNTGTLFCGELSVGYYAPRKKWAFLTRGHYVRIADKIKFFDTQEEAMAEFAKLFPNAVSGAKILRSALAVVNSHMKSVVEEFEYFAPKENQ